ncbi:MAG: hypothetical protein HC847_28605 [Hydrococcus sp. RU_2_2]|nr:hypothetical protein [Hydrococcus sp. RU_2_2]NJP22309.1 hypothetical protein [Hydrococcus sp. CRU_1_1]
MRDRDLFPLKSDDQPKYCLFPSDEQRNEAKRMACEHGIDSARRYLAVVTNPDAIGNGKSGGRFSGNRQLPQIKLHQLKSELGKRNSGFEI